MDSSDFRPFVGCKAWVDQETCTLLIRDSSDAILEEVCGDRLRLEFWGARAELQRMAGKPTSLWIPLVAIRAIRDVRTGGSRATRVSPPPPIQPKGPDPQAERTRALRALQAVRTLEEADRLLSAVGAGPYGEVLRDPARRLAEARPLLVEPGSAFSDRAWQGEWPDVPLDLAAKRLEAVRGAFPGLVPARLALVLCCGFQGKFERGAEIAEALLKEHPDTPGLRTELASQKRGMDRFVEALSLLDEEIARGTATWATHYYLATTLASLVLVRLAFTPGRREIEGLRALETAGREAALQAHAAAPAERRDLVWGAVSRWDELAATLQDAFASAPTGPADRTPTAITPVNGPPTWQTSLQSLPHRVLQDWPPNEMLALGGAFWHDKDHLLRPFLDALKDLPLHCPWPVQSQALGRLSPQGDHVHFSIFLFATDQPRGVGEAVAQLIVEGRGTGWIDKAWVDALSISELNDIHFRAIRQATRRLWPPGSTVENAPLQLLGTLATRAIPEAVKLEHWDGLGDIPIRFPRPLGAACLFAAEEDASPPWLAIELYEPEEPGGSVPPAAQAFVFEQRAGEERQLVAELAGRDASLPPPRSSGPLAPLVGQSCSFSDGRLGFASSGKSQGKLEYASPRWLWIRDPQTGKREVHGLASVLELPGAPRKVRRQIEKRSGSLVIALVGLLVVVAAGVAVSMAVRRPEPVKEAPELLVPQAPAETLIMVRTCNVRPSPATTGEPVGTALEGTECIVLSRQAGWVEARCGDFEGWLGPTCVGD